MVKAGGLESLPGMQKWLSNHSPLPLSLLEIGGGREEEKKVVSGGRNGVEMLSGIGLWDHSRSLGLLFC